MRLRPGILILAILALLPGVKAAAQSRQQVDSLVSLLSAKSMELIEKNGVSFRKVTGPARFFHNNTYLLCDTALWNVSAEEIDAIGNVKILQNETVLTSDRLIYLIPQDLAQFRGTLVQLQDKDRNTLRTRHLDYNTRDSVAVFAGGGAMKDKDGQIIESLSGTYDSKIKTFTFSDNVNMFTDSIFVKTSRLDYDTGRSFATFGRGTDAWKDDDMLSSDAGWYDRLREVFLFRNKVHGMTPDREAWADSVYFHRNSLNVEMLGNAQLTDTTRDIAAVAGRMLYTDSLSRIDMMRDPAVIGLTEGEKGQPKDTVYFGADTLIYYSVPRFKLDSTAFRVARKRLEDINADAVTAFRRKAAEEAAKAAEEAARNDPAQAAKLAAEKLRKERAVRKGGPVSAVTEGLKAPAPEAPEPPAQLPAPSPATDSLSIKPAADSLASAPKDTSKVGFLQAIRNVKLFRKDIQMACDSLAYCDLDSLVRLYKEPMVWNEGTRQYAADSIHVLPRNGALDRAYLMSNAFVTIKEDTLCFDQIRSAEMLAYFDKEGSLRRFDALGDANAVFYIKEDSTFATVNKAQAKMLYAQFKDGEIDRVYYFEEAKNNAFPLAQMKSEDRKLKGFNWQPEIRPADRKAITSYTPRASERAEYSLRPRAAFRQTDIYFPGYMAQVYKSIRDNKAKRKAPPAADTLKTQPDSIPPKAAQDTLTAAKDTLAAAKDSLAVSRAAVKAAADTLKSATRDSLVRKPLSSKELKKLEKQRKKALTDSLRALKSAAREKEWARLDSLDAVRDSLKLEKKKEKARARKLKLLKAQKRQEEKDAARIEKYRLKYLKKKEAAERREERARLKEEARRLRKEARNIKESAPEPVKEPERKESEKQEKPTGVSS